MKIEKWTLGLAAAGLVTLAPALLAQTATTNAAPVIIPLQTALSATTISGYVDTSAEWNPGTGNANPAPYAFNAGKQDGFNVDSVDLKIAKAEDDSQWATGYVLELSFGPDAIGIDGGAYPIRQAYVELKMPVGNGIDWQLGRWDNLLGYESSDSYKNPNYTRSYGYSFEPTEHTGLLASYKFCDAVSLQVGVADTVTTPGFGNINDRGAYFGAYTAETKKSLVSLLTLTAPDSWGGFKGSSFYAGFDLGQGGANTSVDYVTTVKSHDRSEGYLGVTLNTPIKDFTLGASFDGIEHADVGAIDTGYFQAYAAYASYKLTDKLTLNGRLEYAQGRGLGILADANNGIPFGALGAAPNPLDKVVAATGTLQYDLWANVITRLEVRWDHSCSGADAFGGTGAIGSVVPDKKNDVMVAANVIYKF